MTLPIPNQPLCKPCACGNPDCFVRQREKEKPFNFQRRRYASRTCWKSEDSRRGALIAPIDWLAKPSGRIIAQRKAQGLTP